MTRQTLKLMLVGFLLASSVALWAADDMRAYSADGNSQYTGFSNVGSILNTRHNLTQSTLAGNFGGKGMMSPYRNDYGEVCVYCHTPHGANVNVAAPLWNRATPATSYTTYDKLGTNMTQTVYQPGGASLPCLSCHDGQQAVDAIINMPGSGRYNPTPGNTPTDLSTRWPNGSFSHAGLKGDGTGCMSCHSPANSGTPAVDFTAFAIGTDLRNDHPVGVTFPATTGSGTDWNTPNGVKMVGALTTKFFDENGNGRLDKNEIRVYDTGNGPSVECGSCHDPHGVPGGGGKFNATFLRKSNTQSGVCLTCHAK